MSKQVKNGFKGTIAFFQNPDYSWFDVDAVMYPYGSLEELIEARTEKGERVFLGSVEVDVSFGEVDVVAALTESLEKQIKAERSASQQRINVMLGKIRDLQALESPE